MQMRGKSGRDVYTQILQDAYLGNHNSSIYFLLAVIYEVIRSTLSSMEYGGDRSE